MEYCVRCFNCGHLLSHVFSRLDKDNSLSVMKVMDEEKIKRYCCRSTILASDLNQNRNKMEKPTRKWINSYGVRTSTSITYSGTKF